MTVLGLLPRALTGTIVALITLAMPVLAACGGDDDQPEGPPPPSVAVAAGPASFTIGGSFRPGVNRITFNNAAERPRNAQLIRLGEGFAPRQLLDEIEAGARWPEWATYVGGPGLTEPGRSMSYEVVLEPAQYVMLSLLPDNGGALRIQPDVVQAFLVEGEPSGAAATRPTLTVTAGRSALEAPATHSPGDVRLRLVNEDDTPHDVSVFALTEGATPQDLVAYLDGRTSDAPGVFAGGVQAVEPGESGLAVLFLTAGEYALVSLFPEPDGVTPGFQVGMIRGLTVE
jgi:hypothetical protein